MSSKKILTGPGKLSGVSRNGPQDCTRDVCDLTNFLLNGRVYKQLSLKHILEKADNLGHLRNIVKR